MLKYYQIMYQVTTYFIPVKSIPEKSRVNCLVILVFAVYTVFNSYNYFYIGDVLSVLTIVNINWEKKIMVNSLLH